MATFVAILLGVGFAAATLALTAAAKRGAADAVAVQYSKADVVLFGDASTAGAVAERVARKCLVLTAAWPSSTVPEVDVPSWPEGHVPGFRVDVRDLFPMRRSRCAAADIQVSFQLRCRPGRGGCRSPRLQVRMSDSAVD